MDRIFAVIISVEKYLQKDRKLSAAFIDMKKVLDRVPNKDLWDILMLYAVGR